MALTPMTRTQWVRFVGNLVNLSTPTGLLIAAVGRARIETRPGGIFLGEGYRLPFPIAAAFTTGNVITAAQSWADLLSRNPDLLRHEEVHTWQYFCCAGFGFYPLYGVCLAWSMIRTGDRAAGNVFERQAGLRIGGYRELPTRPVSEGLTALAGQAVGLLRSRPLKNRPLKNHPLKNQR